MQTPTIDHFIFIPSFVNLSSFGFFGILSKSLASTDFLVVIYVCFISYAQRFMSSEVENWNKCSYKNYFFFLQTTQKELLQQNDMFVFFIVTIAVAGVVVVGSEFAKRGSMLNLSQTHQTQFILISFVLSWFDFVACRNRFLPIWLLVDVCFINSWGSVVFFLYSLNESCLAFFFFLWLLLLLLWRCYV